jgi:transcriptional regulator with XRE-family HTH domain
MESMMEKTDDVTTLKSASSLRSELIKSRADKDYRHGYADESTTLSVATQLKVLREQRDWTQAQLAAEAGMKQSMISRYENVNYSSWSINTLRKLAEAFDVWLDVRFRSFGELVTATEEFSRESLQVPKFDDDPFFKETPAVARSVFENAFSLSDLKIGTCTIEGIYGAPPRHPLDIPSPEEQWRQLAIGKSATARYVDLLNAATTVYESIKTKIPLADLMQSGVVKPKNITPTFTNVNPAKAA